MHYLWNFKYRWKRARGKEKLNKFESCVEISCFRRIKIFFGILRGPQALLILREDMMLAISSLSVSSINIENCINFLSIHKNFMRIINVLLCSFSNWGKIVAKDVTNFRRISGCIYTMRECSRYSWYDILHCYNSFNACPCVF